MPDRGMIRPAGNMVIMAPEDIWRYWDMMQPALERLRAISTEQWRPEDIYHSIKAGTSACFYNPTSWDGFLIFTFIQDFAGRLIWIWAAHAEPGCDVPGYWAQFLEYAREHEIVRLRFSASRIGWYRRAKTYGFQARQTIFEMQI